MIDILIWLGSGFAFALGICVGAWAMRATFPKDSRNLDNANDLLRERNEIGRRQVAALERIASKLETS